ncbi:hypothetical protein [Nocardia macrotermitis]|uniref:Uncharacterized protein n=1 Tax=Nocardia macrotermitis TaxID=2585198 RepID=A0A7K0D553_9NOCA|nr:hypothetical protein [Nocardia macrotermitis]MQY20876.1 hypothetical protein [Nocardia macrotermitis]
MTYPPGSDPYGNPTPQSPDASGWGGSGGYQQVPDAGWGQTGNAHPAYQQPQPGYPQQPEYQQQSGYQHAGQPGDTQQGWQAQQPGWQPQPGQFGQPGGFEPPRRNRTPLIAGGIAAAVVLVVSVVALVVVLNRHSGSDDSASASGPSLVSATSSSSAAPTTTTTTSSAKSGRFSYTEYAHDWNFGLGGVHLHADWVEGRDHATCGDIENDGKLTALGCQYAAEMVYKAENGAIMLTQYVMNTTGSDASGELATQYADADLKMRPGSYIADFAVGKWQTKAQGDFVVLTVVTATSAVTEDTAKNYLHYLEADMASALLFR